MSFFKQLADSMDTATIGMAITKAKDGRLTVSVKSSSEDIEIKPFTVTGTPEELEDQFVNKLLEMVQFNETQIGELEDLKGQAKKPEAKPKPAKKPTASKSEAKPKPAKKPATPKAKAEPKPAVKPVEEKKETVKSSQATINFEI